MSAPLWVLGDSWADPQSYTWAAASGWPSLLAARLGLGLVNSAVGGGGYCNGYSYPQQAARGAGAGAGALLCWGGINDRGWPVEEVYQGARTTYGLLRRLCPSAPLLVVGPEWGADERPAVLLERIAAVRRAAAEVGAQFVDSSDWLLGRFDLMLDAIHPTPEGHRLVAEALAPELLWLLATAPGPSRPGELEAGGWPAPYAAEEPFVAAG